MRDMISGEYLPLTIEQFCNILPGDSDEMVAPSQAINSENSPIRKSNLTRATTPDHRFGRIDNQWIRRKGGHGRSSWNRVQSRPWRFNPDAHRFTATRLH
ncbi:hypothetical protein ALC57_10789 [Trachymyrmex cornetzi]|uniref:Uncharacterized protein n=1 Tax=Trachymyrmex cornetzi TaxID=471704 RepID=A0A151J385_9HYME|nr:hypothetical protein ALC57_10789 [Trachymyrmex cornetzi]